MSRPTISVVTSVYNGAQYLRSSLESVFCQEEVDFEVIAIDDGSTDESPAILGEFSRRDPRLRVLRQENQGLTRALIRGCADARGTFIARQDIGDLSYRDRLKKQLRAMQQNPDAAIVSCGTRFVGPCGEHLYDVVQDCVDATERLLTTHLSEIQGPSHHGCTFFRKSLYDRVGGYRDAFYFAQDLDLWIRLAEQGRHVVIPETLYQAIVTPFSISGHFRQKQVEVARMILKCAELRRTGRSETAALKAVRTIRPDVKKRPSRLDTARTLYFLGKCLQRRGDRRAKDYFRKGIQTFPLHVKSVMSWLAS